MIRPEGAGLPPGWLDRQARELLAEEEAPASFPPPPPRHRSKGAREDWYPIARPSPDPADARRSR